MAVKKQTVKKAVKKPAPPKHLDRAEQAAQSWEKNLITSIKEGTPTRHYTESMRKVLNYIDTCLATEITPEAVQSLMNQINSGIANKDDWLAFGTVKAFMLQTCLMKKKGQFKEMKDALIAKLMDGSIGDE